MAEASIDMGMVSSTSSPLGPAAGQPSITEWTRAAAAPRQPAAQPSPTQTGARPSETFHDPNPRSRGYSPAVNQRESVAAKSAEPQGEQPSAENRTTESLSPEKLRVGKYEVSEADLAGMMDRQAQEDLRKATLPASPEGYKLELSPDAKLGDGSVEYKFNEGDPSLVALKNWAHAKGMDQSTLSEMLTIYATHEVQQNQAIATARQAELGKIGVNGPQRIDAVTKWITGMVGAADARPIIATLATDAHVRFYETLMGKAASQGAAGFSQSHRAPPDTNPIPGFDNMSFEQRRYAQDQNAARRR